MRLAGTGADRAFRILFAAHVDGDDALAQRQRLDGLQVDRARQALADHGRVAGLVHGDGADQFRRVLVVFDGAVRAGGDLLAAVQQRGRQVARGAADADRLGLAVDALGRQARQAGQRFGDRHVRQLADVFRGDGFDDAGRFALDGDRIFDRAADAGHGHGGDGRVRVQVGGLTGAGGLRMGAAGQDGDEDGAAGGNRAQLECGTLGGDVFHVSPQIERCIPENSPSAGRDRLFATKSTLAGILY